jgi:serine/threonine protein kinase
MLRKFKDRHIVNLIASETSQNSGKREAYLLLEYCPGGHLLSRLNSRGGIPLPLSDICRMFSQILDAVAPLHDASPPVIHRDLKLENILFSHDGLIKLCDFGSCAMGYTFLRTAEERSKAEEIISKETTQMYRAPEMVDLYMRDQLTEKTDIWVTHLSLLPSSHLPLGIGMHPLLPLLHFSSLPRCWKLRHPQCKIKFPTLIFNSRGYDNPDFESSRCKFHNRSSMTDACVFSLILKQDHLSQKLKQLSKQSLRVNQCLHLNSAKSHNKRKKREDSRK